MAFYRQLGNVPPKRHTQHRDEDGQLYFEELMGEEGFSSDSSLLYHRNIPSAIVDSTVWELRDQSTTPNHPLKPRHLKLHDLFPEQIWAETDVVTGRRDAVEVPIGGRVPVAARGVGPGEGRRQQPVLKRFQARPVRGAAA